MGTTRVEGEKITGVCPVLYKPEDPTHILIVRELTDKELTGKLAGMWGIGYETVEASFGEKGESHRQTIERFLKEEIGVTNGQVMIPEALNDVKLAVVRISPPDMQAWVHAYAFPVSGDFTATRGAFQDEVDGPVWIDCKTILEIGNNGHRQIFRAGTYEIVTSHIARLQNPSSPVIVEPNPLNLPPWEFFRLREQGFNQTEALSRLGIDPQPLADSHHLIRSLLRPKLPLSAFGVLEFSLPSHH